MKKYLVQTRCDSEVFGSMNAPAEIIEMFGFIDCTGCDYEVFDVSSFGVVEKLEYVPAVTAPFNYHSFKNAAGEVVFSGFSKEH